MTKGGLLSELPPVAAPAAPPEIAPGAPVTRAPAPPPKARRRRARRRTNGTKAMPHSAITLSVPDPILFMLEELVTERRRKTKQRGVYMRDLVVEAVVAHFGIPDDL